MHRHRSPWVVMRGRFAAVAAAHRTARMLAMLLSTGIEERRFPEHEPIARANAGPFDRVAMQDSSRSVAEATNPC